MKKLILVLCLFHFFQSNGQLLKKITDKAKEKIEKQADKVTNQTVNEKQTDVVNTSETTGAQPASLKLYSKYDFVPGERILVFEDFMQDALGDFPAKWNTNAAGEVKTIQGKAGHWFAMSKTGVYMPDFIDSLPDEFTMEFDMLVDQFVHSWGIDVHLAQLQDRNRPEDWQKASNNFTFNILPGSPDYNNSSSNYKRVKNSQSESATTTKITQFANISKPVHVAIWRQKERLRIYLNEEKTWDIPKAILPEAKLNALVFSIPNIAQWNFLITNLRLAVGAPDTRKKILEQNKWVTHGILFDVNSDVIKPESYGTIKEMANVLKEYADLKVMIIGHTDADGSDAGNLELSKKRATAVKASLAKEFGIDEARMETDGKGESEPIDNNTTPAGKANNRRVEFIKI